jgi:hypothetical protein
MIRATKRSKVMNGKPSESLFARIVDLSRGEFAKISNEASYLIKKEEEAPRYLGLSYEGRLLGFAAVERIEESEDGSRSLVLAKERGSFRPYVIPADLFFMKEVKIKEDRASVEIRLNEETGAGERRKARWAEENRPRDAKPAFPQEYLTESALWAQSIALWLSNNVESPKASAVANLAAGVCGRIAEKAKKGAYRGEDDRELSDLVRMIGMFAGEDYKISANLLALKEKTSEWTGEISTIGEEDIKPCLEEGGK